MTTDGVSLTGRVKTDAGGYAMTDEEYNRKWFERLMKRTVVDGQGCFVWQGPVTLKGYIMYQHRKWRTAGHRVVYMISKKVELATEAFVCHTCDERRCWNPGHLFVGDAKANNNDCAGKGRHHNAVKTHCKYGHEFTPENTYLKVTPNTTMRACRTCDRLKNKKPSYVEWRRNYQRRRRAEKRLAVMEAS